MRQQEFTIAPAAPTRFLPPTFRCTGAPRGLGGMHLYASGELDIASAPVLREALHDAHASARLVVLELGEVTFIDTTGLHVLEDAALTALNEGKRLVLTRVPPHTSRMLELCGLAPALEVLSVQRSPDVEPAHRAYA